LAGASQKASTAVSLLVPILALGLPIFDTLFAMVRRFLERRPIFSPDRGHIHHRLIDMGLTHRRAVLMLYGLSLACTVSAICVSLGRNWSVGAALLLLSVAVTGVIRATGFLQQTSLRGRQRARVRTRHAELLRRVVPELSALFGRARTEEDIFRALQEVAGRAALCSVELLDAPSLHEGHVVHAWRLPEHGDASSLDIQRARYPLGSEGRAVASVRFLWHGDYGEVSAQEEVLLQIVVDLCASALSRVGSRLAEAVPVATTRVAQQASIASIAN
jgi:UDP-GlcNAc:undecaprenyl-phosphate GlcNAc-1-phosphate transferase